MKAIVYERYGSPDVLQFTDVATPTPKADEVLVKIFAAAANPLDWHIMRAKPFLVRLGNGLLKPKNTRLGADIAGRVEAVGSSVTRFQPGDAVFGSISEDRLGGFAEYVCTRQDTLAMKPAALSFEGAASTPVVGFTAIQGLRDKGQIQAGQNVLINGAAGGIGTFAVQYAKAVGAKVTGVCSTRNLDMVRSIGADHVIDYTRQDFTRNGQQYDLIYDAIGNRSVSAYQRALTPGGTCVIAGFTTLARLFEHMLLGSWVSWRGSQKIGLMGISKSTPDDLAVIRDLLESGKVVPVIDRCYPLRETADAIRYLEEGHAQGKVVIMVAQDN